VTHRGAGKTVACVEHLQHAAMVHEVRPRFAYISPFLKQSKTVARDYLRAATAPLRKYGARVHESELGVNYANYLWNVLLCSEFFKTGPCGAMRKSFTAPSRPAPSLAIRDGAHSMIKAASVAYYRGNPWKNRKTTRRTRSTAWH
jgi:hypothetical protein